MNASVIVLMVKPLPVFIAVRAGHGLTGALDVCPEIVVIIRLRYHNDDCSCYSAGCEILAGQHLCADWLWSH